jgi:putative SOS response-associated peptidase YedK
MCGRSRCTLDPDRVAAATGVEHWVDGDDATTRYEPSHNVSPGHVTIVERRVDDKELVVQPMR